MMTRAATRVAVCGAGAMGSGIAQVAAQAGALVKIFDIQTDALAASAKRISESLDALIGRGKITANQAQDIHGRMEWTASLDAVADCELVIEAIVEDATVKARLYEQLETVVSPGTIIATNTSSLPVSRLARSLDHPGRFVGMHFFNPATVMKLVEVIAGAATEPGIVERVLETAQAWGKVAIPVADVPGFIVNRVARPFYAEAFTALSEGAAEPRVIDELFRAVGFRMGPLELTDLIGQDVNFAVARSVYESYFGQTRFVPQLRQAALVDAGWLGRKTGRGVYDYSKDKPEPAPEVASSVVVSAVHKEAAENLAKADPGQFFAVDDVIVGKTRGASAQAESAVLGKPVALLDWFTADGHGSVGFSTSDKRACDAAIGVLAALSRNGRQIADRPGLIVCRTLAQIANAAADAVFEQVADEKGVDAALCFGANYPFGPFAWADKFGRSMLVEALFAIATETGQPLYRPSQYLRRTA